MNKERVKIKPLISVIVPVYNGEKFIEQCIDSITNQTLKDIEILIINDGSKDNTRNIIESIAKKDPRVKVLNQKNSGVSAARNNGITRMSFLVRENMGLYTRLANCMQPFSSCLRMASLT